MYHLRLARDIDYLHKDDKKLSLEKTGVHDGKWLTYYHKHKDEIIYNPSNHFYFNGFKFSTLNILKKMKENRGEPKKRNSSRDLTSSDSDNSSTSSSNSSSSDWLIFKKSSKLYFQFFNRKNQIK